MFVSFHTFVESTKMNPQSLVSRCPCEYYAPLSRGLDIHIIRARWELTTIT